MYRSSFLEPARVELVVAILRTCECAASANGRSKYYPSINCSSPLLERWDNFLSDIKYEYVSL